MYISKLYTRTLHLKLEGLSWRQSFITYRMCGLQQVTLLRIKKSQVHAESLCFLFCELVLIEYALST